MSYEWRFTPDINGSYVNGTWSFITTLPAGYSPGSMASAVLPDGRLIYEGGEINNDSYPMNGPLVLNFTNRGAIFDPVRNTWSSVAPPTGWTTIGGAPGVVLPDGRFMMGRADESGSIDEAILNASSLTWTSTGAGKAEANFEEGWALLPDGTVLTIDINPPGSPTSSERYDPATGHWTSAGSTTVRLADESEIGPLVLRPDGSLITFGALSAGSDPTAIYQSATRTWSAGPHLPTINGQTYTMADGPAALLPNGNVLFAASPSPGHGQTPEHFFEFDGIDMIQVTDPPGSTSVNNNFTQMVVLPTGQIFVTSCGGAGLPQIYTPSGTPNRAWAPVIASAPTFVVPGSTYAVSGRQFNGVAQGAMYGDDAQTATNYPLVRITNSTTGHVFYCRTHSHSTMGVATGATPVFTEFDVPTSIETGTSTLEVVANGIASEPWSLMVVAPHTTVEPIIESVEEISRFHEARADRSISANGFFTIVGTNLAPPGTSQGLNLSDFANGSLPTNLASTCVNVGPVLAFLSYVSPTQINGIVPPLASLAPALATYGITPVSVVANCGALGQNTSNVINASTVRQGQSGRVQ